MARSTLHMVSNKEIEKIHDASLRILERTGAIVRSAKARELLRRAGARVIEKDMRVFFSERLVKDSVKSAAKSFKLGARNPRKDLTIPNEGFPFISTDGFAVQIRDSETLEKRPSTRNDLRKWVTLADALDAVDFLWPTVAATDLPPHVQLVGGLRTCYEHTDKHVQYQAYNERDARLEIEMACAVAGSEEENRKRPHFSSIQCIVAPLHYDEGSTDAVIEFARAGIPVVAMTMVSPGITGPTTLAGSVALGNAEVLGSLAISQLAKKGAPVFYSFVCAPLDMRSGAFASGSPEYAVLSIAGAEMAKHYRIPSMMGGMGTSAKSPSVQAGFEKANSSLPVALAGCDLLTGGGGLNDAGYMSMEQLLIDSQIWEDTKRVWQGIDVNDEEIAMNVIESVGPRGQYLAHPHTLANYRRLHMSRYSDRSSYTAWESGGKRDMVSTVQAEVKRILADHKPVALEKSVERKLEEIENWATRELR